MKKFTINCDFGGQVSPFTIYIGEPEKGHHPLHFQADWLSKQRGGTIPAEVMDAVAKLKDLAEKNNVSLEELCVYAIGSTEDQEEAERATESAISEEESEITESPHEEIESEFRHEDIEEVETDEGHAAEHEETHEEVEHEPSLEEHEEVSANETEENASNNNEPPKP